MGKFYFETDVNDTVNPLTMIKVNRKAEAAQAVQYLPENVSQILKEFADDVEPVIQGSSLLADKKNGKPLQSGHWIVRSKEGVKFHTEEEFKDLYSVPAPKTEKKVAPAAKVIDAAEENPAD